MKSLALLVLIDTLPVADVAGRLPLVSKIALVFAPLTANASVAAKTFVFGLVVAVIVSDESGQFATAYHSSRPPPIWLVVGAPTRCTQFKPSVSDTDVSSAPLCITIKMITSLG